MDWRKRRDKSITLNSLVCLVQALEGKSTTIDLQNESCITGTITSVDAFMGIELEKVIYYDVKGSKYAFETFFIKPRKIRYVHIPKDVNPLQLMKKYIHSSNRPREQTKKAPTWKTKKALDYHKETVSTLNLANVPSSSNPSTSGSKD